MTLREWPDVLRAAGLTVVVHRETDWLSHGPLVDVNVLLHHDASPPGDSPGALAWMKQNFRTASAQIWVDRRGVWHFISYGIAYHSGTVNDARWHWSRSAGIETDHTTGEAWPPAQLASVRRGIAAVLRHEGKRADALSFHKVVAVPWGRKVDPDGLYLPDEVAIIRNLMTGAPETAAPEPVVVITETDLEALLMHAYVRFNIGDAQYIANTVLSVFYQFPDPAARDMRLNILTAAGYDVLNLGQLPEHTNLEAHFGQRVSQFDADPRIEAIEDLLRQVLDATGAEK